MVIKGKAIVLRHPEQVLARPVPIGTFSSPSESGRKPQGENHQGERHPGSRTQTVAVKGERVTTEFKSDLFHPPPPTRP